MAMPDPKFLVDDLIEERGSSVIYSPPKVGKTFVVLDLCISIAAGLPWFGTCRYSGPGCLRRS